MPVGQKFVHLVDRELSQDAQYKSFADIPTYDLNVGSTLKFLPGVYEMGAATMDGLTVEGMGNRDDVVLANLVLTATGNTVTFRGVSFSGNSAVAASTGKDVYIAAGSTAPVVFEDVTFKASDFGVDSHGSGTVTFNRVDATATDRAMRVGNGAGVINYSMLNTGSNAYFNVAGSTIRAVTVRQSFSGGSNGATSTKTVAANVA